MLNLFLNKSLEIVLKYCVSNSAPILPQFRHRDFSLYEFSAEGKLVKVTEAIENPEAMASALDGVTGEVVVLVKMRQMTDELFTEDIDEMEIVIGKRENKGLERELT